MSHRDVLRTEEEVVVNWRMVLAGGALAGASLLALVGTLAMPRLTQTPGSNAQAEPTRSRKFAERPSSRSART